LEVKKNNVELKREKPPSSSVFMKICFYRGQGAGGVVKDFSSLCPGGRGRGWWGRGRGRAWASTTRVDIFLLATPCSQAEDVSVVVIWPSSVLSSVV
jgi:hypothetical protein